MPFTPYHFGPSASLGLLLRRWLDLPTFLLANVVIDVEVLFAVAPFPHRHWHFHTLLLGGLVGALFGAALYLAAPIRNLLARLMHLLRLPYPTTPRLLPMILGGMTGAWTHVLIDALYHYDVQPFWPALKNPLNLFAHRHNLTQPHIQTICLALAIVALVLYAAHALRRRN